MLLSNECDLFLRECLTHKITTQNKKTMMKKAAPPTDPATVGMVDPLPEVLSIEAPVRNLVASYYCNNITI